ncbi:hypothetical protein AFCA_000187 [Aspergillus flavus]|uniref:Uncharacterized protein n=1 Tax=Aspergillus flavus TaxID=5059 RepID=A0AB74BXL7_ASPFL|nr:hypothetical protein COH20_007262 [Aspergillus flavus]RAQ68522.1 hypothetical protein COH21_001736 [Aspergillus flavus]RMZ38545.1 hypothetical protein CA14_007701 [Aspergillus flavus]UCK57252.1 hypothetical protein AFCA_000187 [Aspergillus flavus]
MPEECGGPSWARAVSFTLSKNQTVPGHLAKRGATTSPVFDFTFDYNTALVRRDAGEFSVRMDFSNVPGYWNAVVDAPGSSSSKRDLNQLVNRFYGSSDQWYTKFKSLKFPAAQGTKYTEKLDQLVYHNPQICVYEGTKVGESLSVAMEGTTTVESHFGFSLIATWQPGKSFNVHQAAGFFHPDGETDVTFKIGGQGVLDTSQSLQGSTITEILGEASLAGKSIYKGWASFDLYRESSVSLRSGGGNSGAVAVDTYAESRIQSDWGRVLVNFPAGAVDSPLEGTSEGRRADDKVSTAEKDNISRPLAESPKGFIEVGTTTRVGIKMHLKFASPWLSDIDGELPDMSVSQSVYSRWHFEHDGAKSCLTTSLGTTMKSHLERGSYVGWKDKETKTFVQELAQAGERQCFTGDAATKRDRIERRQLVNPNFDPDLLVPGINLGDGGWNNMAARILCNGCGFCTTEGVVEEPCCGCACIPCRYGTQASVRDDDYYVFPISDQTSLARRDLLINASCGLQDAHCVGSDNKTWLVERQATTPRFNQTPKKLNICRTQITGPKYPSYPKQSPNAVLGPQDFNSHWSTQNVIKYMHNSSQSCTNWAVGKFANSDIVWDKSTNIRHNQFYETEHPFEGQTISRFFNVHMTSVATVNRPCTWIVTWILSRAPWAGATTNVAQLMSYELESRDRQGRLAVFLTDSNWMKGAIVKGSSPIQTSRWDNLDLGDEQLAYLKELGMLFSYWNHPEVWQSFCDSYNGMRDVLLQFDNWYIANRGPSDLVGEWKKFNQLELKRIVERGKASAQYLKESRKPVPGFWGRGWTLKWQGLFTYFPGNLLYQFGTIKLDQTCVDLQ